MESIDDIYPLSPLQQSMLFGAVQPPLSWHFVTQWMCCIPHVDVGIFQNAWQAVIERHTMLRSGFLWGAGSEPLQFVRPHVSPSWEQLDWSKLSPSEERQQLAAFLAADRSHSFDLRTPPLSRFIVIRRADETYRFIWSMHSGLLDQPSRTCLLTEVSTYYEAFARQRAPDLPAARPYRDYIDWLLLQDPIEAEMFWKRTLASFTVPTQEAAAGISRMRPNAADTERQHEILRLSPALAEALAMLGAQRHLLLSTLVCGAWALLWSRYHNTDDVVFGTVVSGRPPALGQVGTIAGPFLNTLPVRMRIVPAMDGLSWLQQVRTQQVEALRYDYFPLAQLELWSQIPANCPLCESVLVFDPCSSEGMPGAKASGLEWRDACTIELDSYPLVVAVRSYPHLALHAAFDSSRFTRQEITAMLERLEQLLAAIADNPVQPLAALLPLAESSGDAGA